MAEPINREEKYRGEKLAEVLKLGYSVRWRPEMHWSNISLLKGVAVIPYLTASTRFYEGSPITQVPKLRNLVIWRPELADISLEIRDLHHGKREVLYNIEDYIEVVNELNADTEAVKMVNDLTKILN